MSAEAAGIARRAAAEIQRRGLHKGDYAAGSRGDWDTCPLCLYGALNYVATGNPASEAWLAVGEVSGRIRRRTGTVRPGPDWNDRPETTAEDVVALLNAVADDLDAQ